MQIENNEVDTTYMQKESSKEGFCYSTLKPNEEKKNNLFAHTTYSNARTGFRGVCGGYILVDPNTTPEYIAQFPDNTNPLITKTDFTVKGLEVVLPINDILCLKNFDEYPSVLGDIVLKMYLNKQSMVWCQTDPKITYDTNYFQYHDYFAGAPDYYKGMSYNRGFTQVGQLARIIENYQQATTTENRLSVTQLRCTKLTCDCYGYNVNQECKRNLANLFTPENPFIIPAMQLDVVSFLNKIGGSDQETSPYYGDVTWAMKNVSKVIVVFPKNSSDITTFTNPMLEKLQLRIQGKKYPSLPFDNTYDANFYSMMIRNSDIGSLYEADSEYIRSLITKLGHDDVNTITDVTSFMVTFQTKRDTDSFVYDGLETNDENVNIQLEFKPSTDTKAAHRNYAPQLWLLRQTYWTADIQNGLRYWKAGSPPI